MHLLCPCFLSLWDDGVVLLPFQKVERFVVSPVFVSTAYQHISTISKSLMLCDLSLPHFHCVLTVAHFYGSNEWVGTCVCVFFLFWHCMCQLRNPICCKLIAWLYRDTQQSHLLKITHQFIIVIVGICFLICIKIVLSACPGCKKTNRYRIYG